MQLYNKYTKIEIKLYCKIIIILKYLTFYFYSNKFNLINFIITNNTNI